MEGLLFELGINFYGKMMQAISWIAHKNFNNSLNNEVFSHLTTSTQH